jgi:hypothetical protein
MRVVHARSMFLLLTITREAAYVPAVAGVAAAVVAQGGCCQVHTGVVHSIGCAGAVVGLTGIQICGSNQHICFVLLYSARSRALCALSLGF